MSAISCHLTSHIHFCQSEQFSIINKNQQRLYLWGRLDLSQKESPESSVQSRPAKFDQRVVSRSDSLEVIVFNKLHISLQHITSQTLSIEYGKNSRQCSETTRGNIWRMVDRTPVTQYKPREKKLFMNSNFILRFIVTLKSALSVHLISNLGTFCPLLYPSDISISI